MKQNVLADQAVLRRVALLTMLIAAGMMLAGCGQKTRIVAVQSYRMGERVTVGKVVYTITRSQWKMELGEGSSVRVPQNRFLLIDLTVTNSGGNDSSMPLLLLYNNKGQNFRELENGEQVSGWLGLLRVLKPVQTYTGTLLFDVVPSSYKLQITDGGEPGEEIFAYVDIPLEIEEDPAHAAPPTFEKK